MTQRAPGKPKIVPLEPGRRVADRYVVLRIIGEGGMGQVVEVEHISLGRRFALKVLRLSRWNDELVRRFNREARALAKLSTPRVAQVTDFGIDDQTGPFYVMELLDGETLEDRLERDVRLSPRQALTICAELCDALADVHAEGIVHRDLKPSNVGLPDRGPVGVKLLDFGLAASMDDAFLSRITKSQQIIGSLPYMAPEQFNGAEPAASMDLYAVGIVLFETLTGRLPFMAPSTAALIHQILATPVPPLPPELAGLPMVQPLLEQLLAKEPEHRFSSATAAAQAIRDVLAKLGGGAPHPLTRTPASDMPPTMEAPALEKQPSDEQVGHMATLLVTESGTRLAEGVPATPAAGSPPNAPAPGQVPPTPLAGVPRRGYPATPLPPSVEGPSTRGLAPGLPQVPLSTTQVTPPASSRWIRIVLVATLGMVFACLTALTVALGLTFLDDRDVAPTRPAPAPARPITAVPDPVPAPPAVEPDAPPGTETATTDVEPDPVSPRDVAEEAIVPPRGTTRRRTRPHPRPELAPRPRPIPPRTHPGTGSRDPGGEVIRQW